MKWEQGQTLPLLENLLPCEGRLSGRSSWRELFFFAVEAIPQNSINSQASRLRLF
jgi:hypothetical protein